MTGTVAVLLQGSPVDAIQGAFQSTSARILATALGLGVLAAAGAVIHLGGSRLKDRFDADDVDAVEASLFTVVTALVAVFLVVVWRAFEEVAGQLAVFSLDSRSGALALIAVLVLVIAFTLTRISKGLLEDPDRDGDVVDRHRREAIHHVVQLTVYGVAALVVLALAGVRPGNLLVGAGAVGLIVGLAARQTLGAVIAGFVLLFARPFEIGDWVVIDEVDGVVSDVTLFNTRLRTWDGEQVIVPNDEVTAANIVNRTGEGRLRVSVDVGVDYDTDVEAAAALARRTMEGLEELLDEPSPNVVTKRFGDSAIVLELRFWIDDPSAQRRWAAQTAVVTAIKQAFDGEEVKIPYPQRELSGRGENGLQVGAARSLEEAESPSPPGAGTSSGADDD
jgi:small-conductance mechanosensitive channel